VRVSLLILHRKLVGTGVFRIVVGNPVFPFCFLVFWGLFKHIYIRTWSSWQQVLEELEVVEKL